VVSQYQGYEATRLKNDAGVDNPRLAYFKIRSNVVSMRLSYVWPGVRWLGANVESRTVLPLVSLDLSQGIVRPPAAGGTLDRSGTAGGLGDLLFAPVLLGWHDAELHQIAGVEMTAPSGSYDKNANVNVGRNYWQIAPTYSVTWMPGRWQLSGKVRYGMNTQNDATGYKSGDEVALEYAAGFGVLPGVVLGVNGYVYRQVSDDVQSGTAVNGNGNRGSVDSIGPYVAFQLTPKATIMVKLQSESGARNRPEGARVWIQAKLPF
jgi:hypothetical protein